MNWALPLAVTRPSRILGDLGVVLRLRLLCAAVPRPAGFETSGVGQGPADGQADDQSKLPSPQAEPQMAFKFK